MRTNDPLTATEFISRALQSKSAITITKTPDEYYDLQYVSRSNIVNIELTDRTARYINYSKPENIEDILSRCECLYLHFIDYLYSIIGGEN